MSDSPDYILDLSSQPAGAQEQSRPADAGSSPEGVAPDEPGRSRKWIGVRFKCCDVYTRIWRNREGAAYVGSCPRCQRKIQAKIGPDGVSARLFEAG